MDNSEDEVDEIEVEEVKAPPKKQKLKRPVLPPVQTWGLEPILSGFKKKDYKQIGKIVQREDKNYHTKDHGMGTTSGAKDLPPINTDFPHKLFTVGMPYEEFLKVWGNKLTCLAILHEETKLELDFRDLTQKPEYENLDKNKYFSVSQINVNCWTALLSLEYVYPEQMDECKNFKVCSGKMITHTLNERFMDKKKPKNKT